MNLDGATFSLVLFMDRTASLLERLAATAPDRDKQEARELAVEIGKFSAPYWEWKRKRACQEQN